MKPSFGRYLALAGCGLGAAALVTQFYVTMSLSMAAGRGVWGSLVFFFSFFTILSNVLAVLCLAASAFDGASRPFAFFRSAGVQTAVTLYMLVVAVIYIAILEALWAPEGLMRLLDLLLHYVMPALVLIHWIFFVPKGGASLADLPRWMALPFCYALHVLVRGALTGEYP
ncbi:MAG: Pr6Pr family membrane protein [Parvibaculaceae bacterium]